MKKLLIIMVAAVLLVLVGCKERDATVEGQGGRKLTLDKPGDVSLRRGGTDEVDIKIDRTNFADAVTIDFDDLPGGVEVVDEDKKITGDEATYTLKAGEDADLVTDHQAKVTAKGPEGISVTQPLKVTVKERE